jgi:peptidoglycan/LPS O-acetylase OafA/YrhL
VVSGFIFEYIVRGRTVDYRRFMGARLWRLYPLYVLVLFFVVTMNKQPWYLLAAQLLTFTPAIDVSGMFVATWSILIEFQFYLIFPFLTLLLMKGGIRQLLLLAAFITVVRLFLWANGQDTNLLAYGAMCGRASQFIAGMVIAKLFYEGRTAFARSPFFLIATVLAIFATVQYYHASYGAAHPFYDVPYTSIYSVVWPDIQAVLFAALTLSFLQVRLPSIKPVTAVFAYIGKISYSIYLTHRMVEYAITHKTDFHIPLQWTHHVRLDTFISCTLIELPIVVAVASLAYYAIEHPFQAFKKEYLLSKVDRPKDAEPAREVEMS